MQPMFKRRLWGYKPSGVARLLADLEQERQQALDGVNNLLAAEMESVHQLKIKLEEINLEIGSIKLVEEAIGKVLLDAFLRSVSEIQLVQEELESKEHELLEQIQGREEEVARARQAIKAIQNQIGSIAQQIQVDLLVSENGGKN